MLPAADRNQVALDRVLLAAALAIAAWLAVDAWSGVRVLAYPAGAVGVMMVHERLRREFTPAVALLTSLLLFAATSLFWSMTHAASAADTLVFAAVATAALAALFLQHRMATAALWTIVAAAPLVASRVVTAPPDAAPPLLAPLFSSSHGLLSLTPIAYVAVIGTAFYARRNLRWAAIALGLLLLWTVIGPRVGRASPQEPFGHGLTAALALLAPGLAWLIERARARPIAVVLPLVVLAVAWNYWLMVQYTIGTLPKDAPVSFAAMVRQQADVHTRPPYFYPFAFPANAIFAWREGVPIDRYELLAPEPRREHFELVMDRSADRFLLEGWGGAGTIDEDAVRWTTGHRSTLVFPLRPAADGLALTLTASARVEEPAVGVELSVLVNEQEVGRFAAAPAPTEARFTLAAAHVGRLLRAGYNRLTIVQHGIHRIDSADTRPAGPLAARAATAGYPVAIYSVRIHPVNDVALGAAAGLGRGCHQSQERSARQTPHCGPTPLVECSRILPPLPAS